MHVYICTSLSVSMSVVGLTLTTCHLNLVGSPLIGALDSSVSPIPTRRAKSDISAMYVSADSVLSNIRFSKLL